MKSTFENTHSQKASATLKRKAQDFSSLIDDVRKSKKNTRPESSLRIAGDKAYHTMVGKRVAHLMNASDVFLIGIGGSNLGTEAVTDALGLPKDKHLFVLETLDEDAIAHFERHIAKSKTIDSLAVFIVSKSGTTPESIVNAAEALHIGMQKFGEAFLSRVVCIGDEGTPLHVLAKKKKLGYIPMPQVIGGRFSAFTAVITAPLLVLGIDVDAYRNGAQEFFDSSARSEVEERALYLASTALTNETKTVNFFTFDDRLRKLGMWYRQLLAESIGKPMTKNKRPFGSQLLPIVSTAADLHSMAQLYLGGQKGVFTHFVRTMSNVATKSREQALWFVEHVPVLKGRTRMEVKEAITQGVLAAYRDAKLPVCDTVLEARSPQEIGMFMTASMYEVMLLAHLFGLNAFDQPQVEQYKMHTKALLSTK